jgi:hypothetical protein
MNNIKSFNDFLSSVNEEAEGSMYKNRLQKIISNTQQIVNMISDDEDLEAWIQDKITIADHNMEAIVGYYKSGKKETPKPPIKLAGDMATGGMLKDEN